ncbi:MAG: hypothetical protein AAGC55_07595 [Myxococcota bacterium]
MLDLDMVFRDTEADWADSDGEPDSDGYPASQELRVAVTKPVAHRPIVIPVSQGWTIEPWSPRRAMLAITGVPTGQLALHVEFGPKTGSVIHLGRYLTFPSSAQYLIVRCYALTVDDMPVLLDVAPGFLNTRGRFNGQAISLPLRQTREHTFALCGRNARLTDAERLVLAVSSQSREGFLILENLVMYP